MKNSLIKIVFLVICGTFFLACNNPFFPHRGEPEIVRPDLPDREGEGERGPETSGENFAVIRFDAAGGTPEPQDLRILWGRTVGRLRPMQRDGFGFAGWVDERGLAWDLETRTIRPEDDVDDDGVITLTAQWSASFFAVNFVTNLPAGQGLNSQGQQIQVPQQQVLRDAKLVEPPVIPREDRYGLVGWFSEDGSSNDNWGVQWDFARDTVCNNSTLYARWSPPHLMEEIYTRTVHLQVNGGTRPPPTLQHLTRVNFTIFTGLNGSIGGRIIDPGPLYREGYTFGGWFTEPTFIREWNFNELLREVDRIEVSGIIIGDPFTLYAKWVPNIYIVSFNGIEVPNPDRQNIEHGERAERPAVTPEPNRRLIGWFTRDGRFDNEWGRMWNFDTDFVTSSMTLHARWDAAVYSVMFYMGNPPGPHTSLTNALSLPTPPIQYLHIDDKVIEPFIPQMTPPASPGHAGNWSFYRWYYRNDHTPSVIGDLEDVLIGVRDTNLLPWNFDWTLSYAETNWPAALDSDGNLHLYARWVPPIDYMVWVPRGSFIMGEAGVSGSPAILHAYPTRRVTLDGFYISRTLINQDDFASMMSPSSSLLASPPYPPRPNHWPSPGADDATFPVHKVSWFDAVEYCMRRTDDEGLSTPAYGVNFLTNVVRHPEATITTAHAPNSIEAATVGEPTWGGFGYRLPTEAEWEFAARGGHFGPPTNLFPYAGNDTADQVAWFNTNSGSRVRPVMGKAPNALGIYDMSGNVSEWVWDWLATYSGRPNPDTNPRGPAAGTERVRRGGAWSNTAANVRSVVRNSFPPENSTYVVGFRVVRGPDPDDIW